MNLKKLICKYFGHKWYTHERWFTGDVLPTCYDICERCYRIAIYVEPPVHVDCRHGLEAG